MAIDLSKLKALALPSKEVTAEVLGEKQTVSITTYGYDVSLKIDDLRLNYPQDGEFRVWMLLLTECAGMSADDAALYISRDGKAAAELIKEINKFTKEFDKVCEDKRSEAKKKSETTKS
jgi:hypothetical protein